MMKKLLLLLCVSIVAGLSGKEIIFIPGWMTKGALYRQEAELLRKTFPGYQIKIWHWESNKSWFDARGNSEKISVDVAKYIAKLPPEQQKKVILIGHSLGGRCAVHTAHHLKENNIRIRQIILLGSAINRNDHRFSSCADVSIKPVFNIFCPDDYALETYNCAEIYAAPFKAKLHDHRAAGQRGIANAHRNIWQFKLQDSLHLRETMKRMAAHYSKVLKRRLYAPWAEITKDFRDGTNHMCDLYIAELHRIYPDAKSHKTQVLQNRPPVNIPDLSNFPMPKVHIPKVKMPKVHIPNITSINTPELKKHWDRILTVPAL